MQASTLSRPAPSSALPALLARYVNGELPDGFWHRLMLTFDAGEITTAERQALARFVNDLLAEGNPNGINLPKPEETTALLMVTRAA